MNSNTIFISARIKTFAESCKGMMMRYKYEIHKTKPNCVNSARRRNTASPNSMAKEFWKTSRCWAYVCVGLKTHLCINFTNRQMEDVVYYIHLTWWFGNVFSPSSSAAAAVACISCSVFSVSFAILLHTVLWCKTIGRVVIAWLCDILLDYRGIFPIINI